MQMMGATTAGGGSSGGATCTAVLALISDALSTPAVTAVGQVGAGSRGQPKAEGICQGSIGNTLSFCLLSNPTHPFPRDQVSFYFSTPAGAAYIPSFQCRLSDSQGSTTGGKLHNWRACTSPGAYSGLADGYYTFQVSPRDRRGSGLQGMGGQGRGPNLRSEGRSGSSPCPVVQVRPIGQGVADTRKFVVDSTPPVTFISSTLPNPAGSAPSPVTSQDSVSFNFSATDLMSVEFTCTLALSAGSPIPPYLRTSQPGLALGWSTVCVSPLTVWGLYFGTYTFTVRADRNTPTSVGPLLGWSGIGNYKRWNGPFGEGFPW